MTNPTPLDSGNREASEPEPEILCDYCKTAIVGEDYGDGDSHEHLHRGCALEIDRAVEAVANANVGAQEEVVSTLWDFARAIVALDGDHSFADKRHCVSVGQLAAIHAALERIVGAYGFNVMEIQ